MRFVDFLRAAVLLCGCAATVLAAATVLRAGSQADDVLVLFLAGWWLLSGAIGAWLGRRAQTNSPIARLLAGARSTSSLPEHRPGALLLNRLWPLLVSTMIAIGLGIVAPQIPGIATGFAIVATLAWRRQETAVTAIEERDGVAFYVEPTSPLRPIKLVRAPGFRRDVASANGRAR